MYQLVVTVTYVSLSNAIKVSIVCPECNYVLRSWFERHLQYLAKTRTKTNNANMDDNNKLSRCNRVEKCPKCGVVLLEGNRKMEDHNCFEKVCKYCRTHVTEEEHLCYQPCIIKEIEEDQSNKKLVFYAETSTSEQLVQCKGGYKPAVNDATCTNCKQPYCAKRRHTVVLQVCESMCEACDTHLDVDDTVKCSNCGSSC